MHNTFPTAFFGRSTDRCQGTSRFTCGLVHTRGRTRRLLWLSLVLPLLLLNACATREPYSPINSLEQAIFIRADSAPSPHEVRLSPDDYIHRLVVWVGTVENIDFSLGTGPSAARILLKHQQADFEQYSSRGDEMAVRDGAPSSGYFQIAWPIAGYQDYERLRTLPRGSQLIAYGYPTEIVSGVVGLNPLIYVRPLGQGQR